MSALFKYLSDSPLYSYMLHNNLLMKQKSHTLFHLKARLSYSHFIKLCAQQKGEEEQSSKKLRL